MNKKKVLAILLSTAMLMTTVLAGCSNGGNGGAASSGASTGSEVSGTTNNGGESKGTIVLGNTDFNEKLSPFFATTANDNDLMMLVCEPLITNDRQGTPIGLVSEYTEPEVTGEGDSKQTVYTFKIKDGVKFSDGTEPTSDDLYYALKVFCDPAYDGSATFYSLPIVGMNEWRYNNSKISELSEDAIAAEMEKPSEATAKLIIDNVITPTLTSELAWVASIAEESFGDYGWDKATMPDVKDRFAAAYGMDEAYDSTKVADEAQVLADIIAQYGADYKTLGSNYAGDPAYYEAQVYGYAKETLAANIAGGQPVDEISGVELPDNKTIKITLNGVDPTAIWSLGGLPVVPRSYYGADTYTRGDLSNVKAKNMSPVGTGPYKFVSFENGVVSFEANATYWQGTPKTAKIKYQVVQDASKITATMNEEIDITDPQASPDNIKAIEEAGLHKELVDNNGYGYLAINAERIPDVNVRKGIFTLVSGYRKAAVQSAYGDTATVIERPMSRVSWAYPEGATEVYIGGKEKALEYFQKAGYTQEGGKLVKDGKVLHVEVTIGDLSTHPVAPALNQAKLDMEAMGGEMILNDVDPAVMFEQMDAGSLDMWAAAWQATLDPDMYQIYHSASAGNKYHIKDTELDKLITAGKSTLNQEDRKEIYTQALDRIMDDAIELPLYQRSNMFLFNQKHVAIDSLPEGMTPLYSYKNTMHVLAAVS